MGKILLKLAAAVGIGYIVQDMIKCEVRRQIQLNEAEENYSEINTEEVACEDFFAEAEDLATE